MAIMKQVNKLPSSIEVATLKFYEQ